MRAPRAVIELLLAAVLLAAGGCSYDFDKMFFPCGPEEYEEVGDDLVLLPRCPNGMYCAEDEKCRPGDCGVHADCPGYPDEDVRCVDHKCVQPESLEFPEQEQTPEPDAELGEPDGEIELVEPEPVEEIPLPAITALVPDSGPISTLVRIQGQNFGVTPEEHEVRFAGGDDGAVAEVLEVSDTQDELLVRVPEDAETGTVSVTVGGEAAISPSDFTVTTTPAVTGFSPESGIVGTVVTITGFNFSADAGVPNDVTFFDGVLASGSTDSTTEIVATVPAGAATGTISVTVGGATGTSEEEFVVVGPPTVSGFFPPSGFPAQPPLVAGTRVTITGSNFDAETPANNAITFAGDPDPIPALLIGELVTSSQLVVHVPAGAVTGTLGVTVGGQTATSAEAFVITAGHPTAGTVIHTQALPAAAAPRGLDVSADNRHVYVAAHGLNQLLVLDGDALPGDPDNALLAQVDAGTEPVGVATTPDGRFVLVSNSTNGGEVWVFDEAKLQTDPDNALQCQLDAAGSPVVLKIDPTGTVGLVLKDGGARVTKIDASLLAEDSCAGALDDEGIELKIGSDLVTQQYGVDFSDDGERAVLTGFGTIMGADRSVLILIDTVESKVKNSTPLAGADLRGTGLMPDASVSFSANWVADAAGAGKVARYDHIQNRLASYIEVPDCRPHGLVKTPDGTRVFATCVPSDPFANSAVVVIDTTSNTVLGAPQEVQGGAFYLAMSRDGRRAFVANNLGNSVSVIE